MVAINSTETPVFDNLCLSEKREGKNDARGERELRLEAGGGVVLWGECAKMGLQCVEFRVSSRHPRIGH